MPKNNNILQNIISESKAYASFKDIEKLVEHDQDLSMVPLQPLYISLLNSSASEVARIVPRLSSDQRQALLDLDFWNRDVIDVNSFEFWVEVYSLNKDKDLTESFVDSEDFLLYLKARTNIYTFDPEDPEYPDHDYYFLTDDNLLLVEYGENFQYANELRYLIRNLYDLHGVENAYTKLFKLINDSFPILQEWNYQEKKERLREYGFVDYYEAREKLFPFRTHKQLETYIKTKESRTGSLDNTAVNQSLHPSLLGGFSSELENITNELSLIDDPKRVRFLQFTFIRMVNSLVTLEDGLRQSRVELNQITRKARVFVDLAIQYVRSLCDQSHGVFERFDFSELYKIGNTLVHLKKEKLQKSLKEAGFNVDSKLFFLGTIWNSFLEDSLLDIPRYAGYENSQSLEISSLKVFEQWSLKLDTLDQSLPFIAKFYEAMATLKEEDALRDEFYLNYKVGDIDFEAILISSFINFQSGDQEGLQKLGVTLQDLKAFIARSFEKQDATYRVSAMKKLAFAPFLQKYGLDQIFRIDEYLYQILKSNFDDYEFDSLGDKDFHHVGGAIILNQKSNH